VFGSPDFSAVLVLLGLFAAVLLALLSYQRPGRGLVTLGWGLLVLATAVALLLGAFGRPGLGPGLVMLLMLAALMALLLTYQNPAWAHAIFWIGVLTFLLALPFLTFNRGDLALFCLIAGPGLLMLVAVLFPEVPARYARLGVTDAPEALTPAELSIERQRYTRLATGITLVSIAGVWLFGGVPKAPAGTVQAQPVTFDAALAARGQPLFTEYGCNACHSVNGTAGVGPSLQNVYNHPVRLNDGSVVLADEAYIRRSILEPNAQIVNGFTSGTMLSAIQGRLPEISQPANLNPLVEYIKSLAAGPAAAGASPAAGG
jgi:cytochrome c oxidase subunit 2